MKRMIRATSSENLTMDQLAQAVADYFLDVMKEEEFDTFDEMKQCYWWTPEDIKDEVDAVLRDVSNESAYIDELDRSEVFSGQGSESIPYRQFSRMWRNIIKKYEKE